MSEAIKRCPVCGNPVHAPPPETICNPHNCPSWAVTHVYDRKTRAWVPEPEAERGNRSCKRHADPLTNGSSGGAA